jgi:hypothetical protein
VFIGVVVGLFILTLASTPFVRSYWSAPSAWETRERAPTWWVWGDAGFRAWLRCVPTLIASFLVLLAVGLIGSLGNPRSTSTSVKDDLVTVLVVLLGLLMFALLLIAATIAVYNRPKIAVPPRFRTDSGLAEQARGRRR